MAAEDRSVAVPREAYGRWAESKGRDRDGWTAVLERFQEKWSPVFRPKTR